MFIKRRASGKKGFTLIELLVVIAIIGLLASIILASLDQARKKGRDARRIADVKEIQLALELYYDANNTYPAVASLSTISTTTPAGLSPTYISTTPLDPTNSGSYLYQYQSLTSANAACSATPCPNYIVVAQLESASNASSYTTNVGGAVCVQAANAPFPYCAHS